MHDRESKDQVSDGDVAKALENLFTRAYYSTTSKPLRVKIAGEFGAVSGALAALGILRRELHHLKHPPVGQGGRVGDTDYG